MRFYKYWFFTNNISNINLILTGTSFFNKYFIFSWLISYWNTLSFIRYFNLSLRLFLKWGKFLNLMFDLRLSYRFILILYRDISTQRTYWIGQVLLWRVLVGHYWISFIGRNTLHRTFQSIIFTQRNYWIYFIVRNNSYRISFHF